MSVSVRSQFPHESEDSTINTPYGNSAKRYRPFYESGPSGGNGFTAKNENFEVNCIF